MTETLVFYFSGHGASFPGTLEHYLALEHGGVLVRSELLKEMQKKTYKCLILLTDCCSAQTGYDDNQMKRAREKLRDLLGDEDPADIHIPNELDTRTIDSLFLRHEGTIDITAATPSRERRLYTVIQDPSNLSHAEGWTNLRVIGMCCSERNINGEVSSEMRFFIGSKPAKAHFYGKALRNHWGIENGLHWHLDVSFNEEQNRTQKMQRKT